LDVGLVLVRQRVRDDLARPQPLASTELQLGDLPAERRDDDHARPTATELRESEILKAGRRRFGARSTEQGHQAASTTRTSMPRVAKIRATVSPILLLGVLAPAVSPIRTAGRSGIQSVAVASLCLTPAGRNTMRRVSGSILVASSIW